MLRNTIFVAIQVAVFSSAVVANAAVVFTDVTITSESDILDSGTEVFAHNYGDSAANVDINGVMFMGVSAPFGWSTGTGDFSSDFVGDLDLALSTLVFGSNLSPRTISLPTTVGNKYRVQFLFDNDMNTRGDGQEISILGDTFTSASPLDPSARVVRAEFTATLTSTDVTFNSSLVGHTVNAVALHSIPVPEPNAFAMFGMIGMFGIARRRWIQRSNLTQTAGTTTSV